MIAAEHIVEASSLARLEGIAHGFFTRLGGTSDGLYDALNCGLGSGDERAKVKENRARVGRALDAVKGPVTPRQVHSAVAVVVEEAWGAEGAPPADAVVTNQKGLAIGVLTADCAPVLFADGQAGIVAAAHAGWRGALDGILEATVAKMVELGAARGHIRAALGPCIHQPSYEVGEEFEARFVDRDAEYRAFFSRPEPDGRPHFDLPGFVLARLRESGLDEIEACTSCTYRRESLFFSYRRSCHRGEPDYGRQITAIGIK